MPATLSIPSTLNLAAVLDLEAAAPGQGDALPTFKMLANTGQQPMRLSGFRELVIIDLAGASFASDPTPVIVDHDTTQRIGHSLTQRIDANGIHATGLVSSSSEIAKSFARDSKAGFPFQASVGALILEARYVPEDDEITVNGKTWNGPIIVAAKSLIKELSVTVLGADGNTKTLAASQKQTDTFLEVTNMPAATDTHDLKAEKERITQIAAAFERYDGLESVFVGKNEMPVAEFKSHAIREGMSVDQAELHLLRASYPRSDVRTGIHRVNRSPDALTIEAALASRCGIDIGATYGDQVATAADRLPVTGMLDAAKLCCQMAGKEVDFRNREQTLRAAFSTHNFGDLLSNVAGKNLENAYRAFPSILPLIAKRLEANDFKVKTGIRVSGDTTLLQVANDGEIKHGSLDDAKYTYSILTYGRLLGLDRKTLINDDLSGLEEIPRLLGRGAAVAREEVFYTLVLANTGSFFAAGNSNLLSGGTSVLSATSLASAVQKFLEQLDTQGKPIGSVPKYLVVPPALKATGDELYVSRTLNVGSSSASTDNKLAAENVMFGRFQPLVSPWLGTKPAISGSSDTQWYLFGDVSDVPAFGIAYLGGKEFPTIEQQDMPFSQLGTAWRAVFDFGVCQIDTRGAVKSAGA